MNRVKPHFARIAAGLLAAVGAVILFERIYPLGVDWFETFGRIPSYWPNIYANPHFANPPWVVFLLPHVWLPMRWGNAANLCLNITALTLLMARYKGGWQAYLLTFTSPLFLDLLRTNNVEWIPVVALLLPPAWGLPLLLVKPQVFGGIALVWWKRARYRLGFIVPLLAIAAACWLIWGNWISKMGLHVDTRMWNFAPWPLGVPVGLFLLLKAFQSDDETLAAVSTPLLVPYLAPYSLTAVLALLSVTHRREAVYVYLAFWFYVIIEARRLGLLSF